MEPAAPAALAARPLIRQEYRIRRIADRMFFGGFVDTVGVCAYVPIWNSEGRAMGYGECRDIIGGLRAHNDLFEIVEYDVTLARIFEG